MGSKEIWDFSDKMVFEDEDIFQDEKAAKAKLNNVNVVKK
jgi:hypothetical protein